MIRIFLAILGFVSGLAVSGVMQAPDAPPAPVVYEDETPDLYSPQQHLILEELNGRGSK